MISAEAVAGCLERVRERIAYRATIPQQLSTIVPIDTGHAAERPLRLGFAKARWRINDRVFAMGEAPIEVKRNTVETWLIRNYFTSMPHAMHLHGFHFQVLERQTSPEQIAALKVDDHGRLATDLGWKDTVLVRTGGETAQQSRAEPATCRRHGAVRLGSDGSVGLRAHGAGATKGGRTGPGRCWSRRT